MIEIYQEDAVRRADGSLDLERYRDRAASERARRQRLVFWGAVRFSVGLAKSWATSIGSRARLPQGSKPTLQKRSNIDHGLRADTGLARVGSGVVPASDEDRRVDRLHV